MDSANKQTHLPGGKRRKMIMGSTMGFVTILMYWNLFDHKSLEDSLNYFSKLVSPGQKAPQGVALDLPPMPALDPLPTLTRYQDVDLVKALKNQMEAAQQPGSGLISGSPIRNVSEPVGASVVQLAKPRIETIQTSSAATGSGGGGVKKSGSSKSSK